MTDQLPWFRMYGGDFLSDPKVRMMPEAYQLRLVLLFCLRCNGQVTLHDNEVAFQLRVTNEEWASTKAELMMRGFINEANELLNWDKRQMRSDSSAARVRKHREQKKLVSNVTETPQIREDEIREDKELEEKKTQPLAKEKQNETRKRNHPTYLADSHTRVLPDEWREFARSLGWTDWQISRVWDGFWDYWTSANAKNPTKKDWDQTWRNWCRDKLPPKDPNPQKPKPQSSGIQFTDALKKVMEQ